MQVLGWLTLVLTTSFQVTVPPVYYSLSWQKFNQISKVNALIDLKNPDYELLDAAIFQVTNQVRQQEGKRTLLYLPQLHRAATFHAQAMIDLEFYDHYNLRQLSYRTPDKRITAFGGYFNYTAENIAQYDVINTDMEYCPFREGKNLFKYLNCDTHQPYRAYTYLAYAKAVVTGWLHSPPHRKSLLSENFQYVGCAARFSKNPYQQKKVPFGRLVQNFGGYGPDPENKKDSLKTSSGGGIP